MRFGSFLYIKGRLPGLGTPFAIYNWLPERTKKRASIFHRGKCASRLWIAISPFRLRFKRDEEIWRPNLALFCISVLYTISSACSSGYKEKILLNEILRAGSLRAKGMSTDFPDSGLHLPLRIGSHSGRGCSPFAKRKKHSQVTPGVTFLF